MMKMLSQLFYNENDMFAREKKVMWSNKSYELRVQSLKARVEIQKYEL